MRTLLGHPGEPSHKPKMAGTVIAGEAGAHVGAKKRDATASLTIAVAIPSAGRAQAIHRLGLI